ncbi:MAG: SprT-like domain-containing protein [Gemmataceae bacterium]
MVQWTVGCAVPEVPLPPKDPEAFVAWGQTAIDAFGLSGWHLVITRGVRQLGICRYSHQEIGLSKHLYWRNPPETIRNTLLHEIAHALAGYAAGHGPVWQKIALQIGAKPERCNSTADMPAGPWRAACPGCQKEFRRHKRPATNAKYSCMKCGPKVGMLQFAWAPTA